MSGLESLTLFIYTAFQNFEPYSSDIKYISSKPNILTITFLSLCDEVEIAKYLVRMF
mgnify:FL=1